MQYDDEHFNPAAEAVMILSSFNETLPLYLEMLKGQERAPFLRDLLVAISELNLMENPDALTPFFALLQRTPPIWHEFYPNDIEGPLRMTKDDVNENRSPKEKIKEVENEVPILEKKIKAILEHYEKDKTNQKSDE